ncbi:MAG: hypothetical protein JWM63_470 [Gammaproteobacteria bacterium]|nr:hypothetical protein [Gammaproteobacteria bacterium]
MTSKKLHRYLGLFAAAFWLVQVLTGVALTFRQEIDNATLSGKSVAASTAALGNRIQQIQRAGGTVSSLWVADFAADRFDVRYVDPGGAERLMRVDGAGRILRDGLENVPFDNGGLFRTLTLIHTSLLAGDVGEWIVAVSGILLISNLALGLKLAWPRAGMWRQALVLRPSRHAAARFYGLHRTVGFWIAIPLLLIFAAGVALRFDDQLESALGVVRPAPVDVPMGAAIAPARALDIVLARFPGSTITALSMPTASDAWYRVRVHAAGEVPRMYGTTTLFVSAADGKVLREYAASAASPARTFFDLLYPFHTGELGALPGRLILLTMGIALLVLGVFGIRLWLVRRKPR